MADSSYLLGTHTEELERLGFQHQLWLPSAQEAWQRAGITAGARVLDVGAGPGFAAIELARAVGPTGRVLGLELNQTYVAAGQAMARSEPLPQLGSASTTSSAIPGQWNGLIWPGAAGWRCF